MIYAGNHDTKPALYKIEEYKEYRKQVGLNMIKMKDVARETIERSNTYTLNGSTHFASNDQALGVQAQ
jgi:hypothetical protein